MAKIRDLIWCVLYSLLAGIVRIMEELVGVGCGNCKWLILLFTYSLGADYTPVSTVPHKTIPTQSLYCHYLKFTLCA